MQESDYDIEENDEFRRVLDSTSAKLSIASDISAVPIFQKNTSAHMIAMFRTIANKSYIEDEFHSYIPEVLRPYVGRDEMVMVDGLETKFHKDRIKFTESLTDRIEKNPLLLKQFEQSLLGLFNLEVRTNRGDTRRLSNAWLQVKLLESAISDIYMAFSNRIFGPERYLSGMDSNGKLYSKQT